MENKGYNDFLMLYVRTDEEINSISMNINNEWGLHP